MFYSGVVWCVLLFFVVFVVGVVFLLLLLLLFIRLIVGKFYSGHVCVWVCVHAYVRACVHVFPVMLCMCVRVPCASHSVAVDRSVCALLRCLFCPTRDV